jgi:hypothetical protein
MFNLRVLSLILVLLASPASGLGATNRAASLAYADVLAAVNASANGDTVQLPAGSVTWETETLSTAKRVMIEGAGIGLTTISRGSNSQAALITFSGGTGQSAVWGVSHLTINGNAANTSYGLISFGSFTVTNRNFRFHHLQITNILRRGILTIGKAEGVIDNCYFALPYETSGQAVTIFGSQRSGADNTNNAKSATVVGLGQKEDFVYVENNVFDFAFKNDAAVELYYDAQAVLRYNTVTNACFGVHENGLKTRSATVWEIYGNRFYGKPDSTDPTVGWLFIRSGHGVVYSNTVVSTYTSRVKTAMLMLYRASGTNVWKDYYPGPAVTGTNRLDGNQNHITIGYPAWDQPGWGDPTVWTATNSNHTFHGCYSWGNSENGANVGFSIKDFSNGGTGNQGLKAYDGVSDIPDSAALIQERRDYFNDTVKPGYKPLVYPHPLATSADHRSSIAPPKGLIVVQNP